MDESTFKNNAFVLLLNYFDYFLNIMYIGQISQCILSHERKNLFLKVFLYIDILLTFNLSENYRKKSKMLIIILVNEWMNLSVNHVIYNLLFLLLINPRRMWNWYNVKKTRRPCFRLFTYFCRFSSLPWHLPLAPVRAKISNQLDSVRRKLPAL